MATTQEQVIDAIYDYAENDIDRAVILVTGLFVGIIETFTEINGEDPNKKIHIDGGPRRDITVHAVKEG